MPTERHATIPDDRSEALMAAARAEFVAHEFEGASLNRILAAAGLSKGSFYYYFHDKLDLYLTVVRRALAALGEELEVPLDGPLERPFWDEARRIMGRTLELALTRAEMLSLLRGLIGMARLAHHEGAVADFFAEAEAVTARILRLGREQGAVRNDLPEELLVAVLFAVDEALDRWLVANIDRFASDDLGALTDLYMDFMRRVLLPPKLDAVTEKEDEGGQGWGRWRD